MKRTKTNLTNKIGFTLVEILVVSLLVTTFIGSGIMIMSNFRRSYSKSESSAILMQEAAIFSAKIRNDLNNAILDPTAPDRSPKNQIYISGDQLSFKAYNSSSGKSEPIVYSVEKTGNQLSIMRKAGLKPAAAVIKNKVASITWKLEQETFTGNASGVIRLGVSLDLILADPKKQNNKRQFQLTTRIFPARLNKILNGAD